MNLYQSLKEILIFISLIGGVLTTVIGLFWSIHKSIHRLEIQLAGYISKPDCEKCRGEINSNINAAASYHCEQKDCINFKCRF